MKTEKRHLAPRIWLIQPALPAYRIDFFKRLAAHWGDRFGLYYSPGDLGALTERPDRFSWEHRLGSMKEPFPGGMWQPDVLNLPIRRGDTVIVCGNPRELSMLLLLLKGKFRGFRTIWFSNYWIYSTTNLSFKIRMLLMRLADAVLFYTWREVEQYRAGIGKNDDRQIAAVDNGIYIAPIAENRTEYRASARGRELIFIGRMQPKTRLATLIRALAEPGVEDVKLHIIGDGKEHAVLAQLAKSLAIADRIEWHGAIVDEAKIGEIMARCRLFVYPGPVGLSLLHAMAYGLPAIIGRHDREYNAEIAAFTDGLTGRSFAMDDAKDLASAIAQSIDDTQNLDRWSNEALRRTHEDFNTARMARHLIDFIDAN